MQAGEELSSSDLKGNQCTTATKIDIMKNILLKYNSQGKMYLLCTKESCKRQSNSGL